MSNQLTWADVLAREDIVGGDLFIGNYRYRIASIKLVGDSIVFVFPWSARWAVTYQQWKLRTAGKRKFDVESHSVEVSDDGHIVVTKTYSHREGTTSYQVGKVIPVGKGELQETQVHRPHSRDDPKPRKIRAPRTKESAQLPLFD